MLTPTVQSRPVEPLLSALATALATPSGTNTVLTTEVIAAWRTNLAQLVQAGPTAVSALQAFLDQKSDYAFSRETAQALGYGSAREAAIDALRQIGGPEAVATMEKLLGTTQSPREVALLARNLEETQPGNYRSRRYRPRVQRCRPPYRRGVRTWMWPRCSKYSSTMAMLQ